MALDVLRTLKIPTEGLRSKSWDEFARPGAPVMDLIINLCDQTAREECPTWPGQPVTSQWGIPDPAAVEGTEAERGAAFLETVGYLRRRIDILINFGMDKLDKVAIKRLDEIGRRQPGESDSAEALD